MKRLCSQGSLCPRAMFPVMLLILLQPTTAEISTRDSPLRSLLQNIDHAHDSDSNVGILIDDVDGDGNECFADGDNYEIDPGNTDRGDWGKCIPPPAYAVLAASETRTGNQKKNKTRKLYTQLKDLHDKYCVHIDISISEEAENAIEDFLLGKSPFKSKIENRKFQKEFQKIMSAAVKIAETVGKLELNAPYDGECFNEYTIMQFEIDYANGKLDITEMTKTPETDGMEYLADDFLMCGSNPDGTDIGMACIWTLDDPDEILPEDQAANFDNSDFIKNLRFPIQRSRVDENAATETLFPKRVADNDIHCHYSPSADGFLRVHNYQHDLERKYPGHIRQVCFCDWRNIAKVVTQCDCTLNGSANNGCGDKEAKAARKAGFTCNNC